MVISIGILTAGGGSDEQASEVSTDNESEESGVDTEPEISESESSTDVEENEEDEKNDIFAEGKFEDQLDLSIGDTGTVETLAGITEFTVNEVEILEDVDGEMSDLDFYFLINFTVKNVGEEQIDAREAIDILEATDFLEGTGFSDEAPYYESVDSIEGTLLSEEETTGDVLFVARDAEEYYIRVTEGLVGSGAAKNQIRFTFQKNEVE